jgi:hypothetical protein
MKKISIFALLVLVAFASCKKTEKDSEMNKGQVLLSFEADAPMVSLDDNTDPDTKIIHSTDPSDDNIHIIQWKKGDQISLMGLVWDTGKVNTGGGVKYTLHNFSANRFTLRYNDGSKSFNGYFPNFAEIYPATATTAPQTEATASQNRTTIYLWGTYPATTYECTDTDPTPKVDNKFKPLTPLGFAETQDGTGWPYAIFFASPLSSSNKWYNSSVGQPRIDSYYMSANGVRFRIGCCVARLKLKASKNITNITIVKQEDEWQGFVGPVSTLLANTTNFYISGGCRTRTLTINNGGNLVEADAAEYADVYFACRGLFSGKHYTFTFEAEDGTKCTKQLVPTTNYTVDVYNLGEFTINTWE